MADVVNLRAARKARNRSKAEEEAAANRLQFGQTKGERQKRQAEERRQARRLDGARREPE